MDRTTLFTRELFAEAADLACEFNEYVPPERPAPAGGGSAPSDATGDRPGDDYNRRASWDDILMPHGWRKCRVSGQTTFWTRPGKDPRHGCSATTGKCSTEASGDLLYNFSSSSDRMEPLTSYSKFAVHTLLDHDGDFAASARKLREAGYGAETPAAVIGDAMPPPPAGGADAPNGHGPTDGRLWQYKWASELTEHQESTQWLWSGYIPQNGTTLFSALWKAGKTTLLSHMLKAFGGTAPEFLGQAITPCKVLYVTEEMERHWSRRRNELPLGDHVAFHVQPFQAKPNAAQWAALVKQVVADVVEGGFQLVVFDTLADLWPVVKENDAGEVQSALMVLRQINKVGASVLLVHHLRKGGGAEYTGSRGSGVLCSFPDILVEMSRVETPGGPDNRRKLSGISRYEETPRELMIEWSKDAGFTVPYKDAAPDFTPTPQDEIDRRREERILSVLPETPEDGLAQGGIDKAMREQFGEGLGRKERWDYYLLPLLTDRRIMLDPDRKSRHYYKAPQGFTAETARESNAD